MFTQTPAVRPEGYPTTVGYKFRPKNRDTDKEARNDIFNKLRAKSYYPSVPKVLRPRSFGEKENLRRKVAALKKIIGKNFDYETYANMVKNQWGERDESSDDDEDEEKEIETYLEAIRRRPPPRPSQFPSRDDEVLKKTMDDINRLEKKLGLLHHTTREPLPRTRQSRPKRRTSRRRKGTRRKSSRKKSRLSTRKRRMR